MRRNQVDFAPFSPVLRKARKRIEILFSPLCGQFMIRRNYAKSSQGLSTRILSKMTALTLFSFYFLSRDKPWNGGKTEVLIFNQLAHRSLSKAPYYNPSVDGSRIWTGGKYHE